MLFELGTIAEVIVECHARVVDEEIEGPDSPGRGLDLRRIGDVQGQGGDPHIRVGHRLARARIDPPRAPPQGFGDQRLPDAAVGPGHQDGLAFDCHDFLGCDGAGLPAQFPGTAGSGAAAPGWAAGVSSTLCSRASLVSQSRASAAG